MHLSQFGINEWIHQYQTQSQSPAVPKPLDADERQPRTLIQACASVLIKKYQKDMEKDSSQFWPLSRIFTKLDFFPMGLLLSKDDFPLSLDDLKHIATSSTDFIEFSDSQTMLSKQAFLVAHEWWRANKGSAPALVDFHQIDSQSAYHKKEDKTFLAPSILVEMVGKAPDLSHLGCNNAEVYEKLIAFFTTLETGKLIDLIAASHSSQLQATFPSLWPLLNELLPMENGDAWAVRKKELHEVLHQWLMRDHSVTLAEKLQRLTKDYTASYSKGDLLGSSLQITHSICLRYLAEQSVEKKSWEVTALHNAQALLKLEGAPIHSIIFDKCSFDKEHLEAVAGLSLKHVSLLTGAQPSLKALELLKTLAITKLTLTGTCVDEWLDYVGAHVESLEIHGEVSDAGLKKIQNHTIHALAISSTHKPIDKGLILLQNVSSITLSKMALSRNSILALAQLPITRLTLSECPMRRLDLNDLLVTKTLKTLQISKIPCGNDQISLFKQHGIDVGGELLEPNDSIFDRYVSAMQRAVTNTHNLLTQSTPALFWATMK